MKKSKYEKPELKSYCLLYENEVMLTLSAKSDSSTSIGEGPDLWYGGNASGVVDEQQYPNPFDNPFQAE